jgi:hypothetical protein
LCRPRDQLHQPHGALARHRLRIPSGFRADYGFHQRGIHLMTRSCIANNAIQPSVIGTECFRRRTGRNPRSGMRRAERRTARCRTDSTPTAAVRGILIHEDELAVLVHLGCNLGAQRRGKREQRARGQHCNWDAVSVHSSAFRRRFFGASAHYPTASLGEGRALCFRPQTKDTHTAKKEASPS